MANNNVGKTNLGDAMLNVGEHINPGSTNKLSGKIDISKVNVDKPKNSVESFVNMINNSNLKMIENATKVKEKEK